MKLWYSLFALPVVMGLILTAQEGPIQPGSSTVARPRKPPVSDSNTPAPEPETDLPKIPSKLSPKNKVPEGEGAASFKVETNVVNVDVAVLDDKGHFIPGHSEEQLSHSGGQRPAADFQLRHGRGAGNRLPAGGVQQQVSGAVRRPDGSRRCRRFTASSRH